MSRKKPEARCPECRMRRELCLCAEAAAARASLPRLRTRVLVLMHYKEERLSTNTGRLAELAIPGCEVRLRGQRPELAGAAAPLIGPECRALLLYPSDDAAILDVAFAANLGPGPVTLVVPDGSWRQASKVAKREPELANVARVRLPAGGAPTRYFLRDEPKADGLATFEAIARSLGALEGAAVRRSLEDLFEIMVSRTLRSRGIAPPPRP